MLSRILPVLLFFVLIVVFFLLLIQPEDEQAQQAVARPAPTVDLIDQQGSKIVLPQGQWYAVNFFASWCVPCVIEHPNLMDLQKIMPVVGIAYRDKPAAIQAFLKARGSPYVAVAYDEKGEAAIAYGIAGVPETFLINPEGQIVWHMSGPILANKLDEIKEVRHAAR